MAFKLWSLLALFAACGVVHAKQDKGISSRQSGFPSGLLQIPQQAMSSVFGSGQSGIPNPFSFFSGGSGSSGGGSESSESGSGSSGGGSGTSGVLDIPQQVMSSVVGGSGSSGFPFSFLNGGSGSGTGSSGSGGGSGMMSQIFGMPGQVVSSVFGGRGTGDSGSSSGGLSGESLVSYCEQACNAAIPASRVNRLPSSGRHGSSHGHQGRHGRRSALPQSAAGQHTRQAQSSSGICPTICNDFLSFGSGSGSSSQGSSTGDSGTSASGSFGSSTDSQSSTGSSGGSIGGSAESPTSK